MSKYDTLWNHIKKIGEPTLQLSFSEIYDILGFELDHSFLKYKKELTQYGYQVGKISLKVKTVKFNKVDNWLDHYNSNKLPNYFIPMQLTTLVELPLMFKIKQRG